MQQTISDLNRNISPAIIDAVEFDIQLPPYEKHILSNGVEVYLFNMGTQETMMVNWVFDAGNWYEEKDLVAGAANHLLKNGTSSHTAFEINEQFEFYGAYLNRSCYNETSEISLHCLSKHVQDVLPMVAELISDSIFPEEEIEIFKKNMRQRLEVNLQKSEFVAHREIEAHLFGASHPYGKYSSDESYRSLHRDEIKSFYNKYYAQGRCVIFAAGILPVNMLHQLESAFGHLPLQKHSLPGSIIPVQPSAERKFRKEITNEGVQGSIRVARLFPNRHHPDFPRMQVLNNVLGGFFGSRLMDNIREDKGYTYGIHSYLMNHIQTSGLMISTEAGREVCDLTLVEIYREMENLCKEPIPEDELMLTRNYLIGSILSELDGPFQVAARWKNYILNGLDENYFYNSLQVIRTITPEELQELAQKYFQPDHFLELVVT